MASSLVDVKIVAIQSPCSEPPLAESIAQELDWPAEAELKHSSIASHGSGRDAPALRRVFFLFNHSKIVFNRDGAT